MNSIWGRLPHDLSQLDDRKLKPLSDVGIQETKPPIVWYDAQPQIFNRYRVDSWLWGVSFRSPAAMLRPCGFAREIAKAEFRHLQRGELHDGM